jgi:Arc/MetJ-type ribon-helix-helix transcriptional regulator
MASATKERNPDTGKFIEQPNSLTRKPLAVRLSKPMREELTAVVEAEGKTESECVREAIAFWLEEKKKKSASKPR